MVLRVRTSLPRRDRHGDFKFQRAGAAPGRAKAATAPAAESESAVHVRPRLKLGACQWTAPGPTRRLGEARGRTGTQRACKLPASGPGEPAAPSPQAQTGAAPAGPGLGLGPRHSLRRQSRRRPGAVRAHWQPEMKRTRQRRGARRQLELELERHVECGPLQAASVDTRPGSVSQPQAGMDSDPNSQAAAAIQGHDVPSPAPTEGPCGYTCSHNLQIRV